MHRCNDLIKQTAATVELVTHTRAKTCTIICISVSIHTFINISQRHLQWSRSNQSKVHSWACQKFSWVRSRVEGGGQDGSASLVVQGWWLPRGWRQSRQSSATSVCYAQGEEDPAVATCMHTCAHVPTHARTHAHTHTRMHMHTHTHAHAHTHTCTCTHTHLTWLPTKMVEYKACASILEAPSDTSGVGTCTHSEAGVKHTASTYVCSPDLCLLM